MSVAVAACATKPLRVPANVVVSAQQPQRWPPAPVKPPNAAPQMTLIWFSSLTLEPGMWFDGAIVAGTNVASVEVRTAAFSINADHAAPGFFRFHTHVLELPPLSRRHSYELNIIARNTAGDQDVERATLDVK